MRELLKNIPRKLDNSNIDTAIIDYLELLKELPLIIQANSVLEFLTELKRQKINCGPYPNVTLFEAGNRIMTDLVILFGIKELLNGKIPELKFKEYIVEFGNENNNTNDIYASNKNDILIGEAFNVASSFFQTKKSKSLKKMRGQHGHNNILLLYNSDAIRNNYNPKIMKNEFHLPVELKVKSI